jgi:hypothetical protein
VKLLKCVCNYSYRFSFVRSPKLSVNNTMKWNQNVCMTNVYRWLHMAMCVVFLSSRMCVNVISRMCM